VKTSWTYTLALVAVLPCWGGSGSEPGRIVAPGIAVADVAPDSLSIDFELETASDSFQQGAAKARSVATDLESIAPSRDGIKLSVSHDLTFMQQKKWTSSTKQTHKFRLLVEGVPDGQAESSMVAIVESALTKVANLTVTGYDARLSDARTKQVQSSLLKQAIGDAREFATTAAAEGNLKLQSVRSLRIGGLGDATRPYDLNESVTVNADYYGSRTRAFSVHDDLVSKIHVSVKVVIEYDCEAK